MYPDEKCLLILHIPQYLFSWLHYRYKQYRFTTIWDQGLFELQNNWFAPLNHKIVHRQSIDKLVKILIVTAILRLPRLYLDY